MACHIGLQNGIQLEASFSGLIPLGSIEAQAQDPVADAEARDVAADFDDFASNVRAQDFRKGGLGEESKGKLLPSPVDLVEEYARVNGVLVEWNASRTTRKKTCYEPD